MNTSDLDAALGFFLEGQDIVLQHTYAIDRHLIRAYIIDRLGTPSFAYSNVLKYGKNTITINNIPSMEKTFGYRSSELFFIPREDNSDLALYSPIPYYVEEELTFYHSLYWWVPLRDTLDCPEPRIFLP